MTTLTSLKGVLPQATLDAWAPVAAVTPPDGVLMGGTALTCHLRHRTSRYLDVFTTEEFDPDHLERELKALGRFAATLKGDGTLNGVFEDAKVQFLWARGQRTLVEPSRIAGMSIGWLDDILATKIKVIGDRAELRDYFDLMEIEVQANRFVEEGLQLYMDRYSVATSHASIGHILKGFGYFDDLIDDPQLERERGPNLMNKVISYWTRRQPHLLASFDPYATSPPPWPPAPPG